MLVASPDLVPQARGLSQWIGRGYRRGMDRVVSLIRRLFRRPKPHVVEAVGAGGVTFSGSATGVISVDPQASLTDKVDYLLRRDEEIQRGFDGLRGRIDGVKHQMEAGFERTPEMETFVSGELTKAHAAYLPLRIAGVVFLLIGLMLVTAGNFVD
jgi:hypothetical protein